MGKQQSSTMRAGALMALVGTMLVGGAVAATGAGTLDQQQTTSNTDAGFNPPLAQTFTAGITGGLDQADLQLLKAGPPPPTLTVEIRTTSAGKPTATVLATGTIASADIPAGPIGGFVPVTFTPAAAVTAGTQYALVAYGFGPNSFFLGWRYSTTDSYPGGEFFISPDASPPGANWNASPTLDFAFKTYVTPPSAPAPPAATTCAGLDATITGTAGDDVLGGTSGTDVIVGLGGDDVITSDGGNDIICGGDGADKLKGGSGSDRLYGGSGADRLRGGTGTDTCRGGRGDDTVSSCERP